MSNRLDQEREAELQPKRLQYAKDCINRLGYDVVEVGTTELRFIHNDHLVKFYPYSGWHTGKSIKDGRGLQHLLNQIEQDKNTK